MNVRRLTLLVVAAATFAGCGSAQTLSVETAPIPSATFPANLQAIVGKEIYRGATFAYRVEDLDSGEVIYDSNSSELMIVASVRKLFSSGLALDNLGAEYRFRTPVYRQGPVNNGVLDGTLVLVASGDLTMGARRGPNDTISVTDLDHSEAGAGGNAIAPSEDPLAGYKDLARAVAASGITEVSGDVVVDDRLYDPYAFSDASGEFMANPVFVNDNLIDVLMSPTQVGQPAQILLSPVSEAFSVVSTLPTVAGNERPLAELEGGDCFGTTACQGTVSGTIPINGAPPITEAYPYLQTFRVNNPSNFARTVFIEALRDSGVSVNAPTVAANPSQLLPAPNSYSPDTQVAELVSAPFQQYVNYIFKTSYNLGAETALLLYGVDKGVRTQSAALAAEASELATGYGIAPAEYVFPNGSGQDVTKATPQAVNKLLRAMAGKSVGTAFRDSLTVIGSPGLLTDIPAISNDPTLIGAVGHIFAKSGTRGTLTTEGKILLDSRASAGYIDSKSGRRLIFTVVVNNVGPFDEFPQSFQVFEDLDTISAILWRDL